MRRTRIRKVARVLVPVVLAPLIYLPWQWSGGNFGAVEPGAFYRSGQLGPDSLKRTIEAHRIKTVLNLRGRNPDQPWYRDELAATLESRATHIDLPLSSDYWLTREQAEVLADVLRTCERPVLVHCEWGAERTGLASAFAELLRPGRTLNDARRQFSIGYLYLPTRDGLVMRGHIDRYAAWLRTRGLGHDPDRFLHWIRVHYRPGTPSREDWPCNPYPLKVVADVDPSGDLREVELWSRDRCPPKISNYTIKPTTR